MDVTGPFGLRPIGLGFFDLAVKDPLGTTIGLQIASAQPGSYASDQMTRGLLQAEVFRADLYAYSSAANSALSFARVEITGRQSDVAWGSFDAVICRWGEFNDTCNSVRGRFSARVASARNEALGSSSFACANPEDCTAGACGRCTTIVYSPEYESSCTYGSGC
jgi:hypothetical protein